MIGLDTNVLVRYIMQDDPKQSPKATRLIESMTGQEPGFVSIVSVIELVWVLSSSYQLTRAQVASTLELLLRSEELVLDRTDTVAGALRVFQAGTADFADCLIERISHGVGCSSTFTFDVGASKAAGMALLT